MQQEEVPNDVINSVVLQEISSLPGKAKEEVVDVVAKNITALKIVNNNMVASSELLMEILQSEMMDLAYILKPLKEPSNDYVSCAYHPLSDSIVQLIVAIAKLHNEDEKATVPVFSCDQSKCNVQKHIVDQMERSYLQNKKNNVIVYFACPMHRSNVLDTLCVHRRSSQDYINGEGERTYAYILQNGY